MIPCFPWKARYTGIHRAACSLLQLVHTNIPSGDLISSWLDILPGRSSAGSLCILRRREKYFVSTEINTEVWNEKFTSLFLKPWGLSRASVMTTLGPKRRPRNKPQMWEQHNWYTSTAVSALQGNLPQMLLEHSQQNTAWVTQGPPTTGIQSAKDTISIISWKQFYYCPVAYCSGCPLRVTSYLHWSRVQARLSKTERGCCKPPVPWLLYKLVCSVVSCSLLCIPALLLSPLSLI